jgi:hypothetical protein
MGAAADPEDQHVKVAVRCRPLNEEEAAMNAAEIVTVSPNQGIVDSQSNIQLISTIVRWCQSSVFYNHYRYKKEACSLGSEYSECCSFGTIFDILGGLSSYIIHSLTPSCKHPPSSSATYVLKWPTRYL